jgi:hypothetical protein
MKWYRTKTSSVVKKASWDSEFGAEYEVPNEILNLVSKGYANDMSWHNDVSPSFGKEVQLDKFLRLWIDHKDPYSRELSGKRFSVTLDDEEGNAYTIDDGTTDDVNEAVSKYLKALNDYNKPKDKPLTLDEIRGRMWDLTNKPGKGLSDADRDEMVKLEELHSELDPKGRKFPKFIANRKRITKTAEWGHGDTLDGQMMKRELKKVSEDVRTLRAKAISGGPNEVLPRWKGEIRYKILLLPTLDKIARMSMSELGEVREQVDKIKASMSKYNQNFFMEIMKD